MNHCFVGSEGIMWCGGIHIPEQIACMPVLHNVVHYHAGDSLLTEDLLGQVNNCFAGAAVLSYLPDKGIFWIVVGYQEVIGTIQVEQVSSNCMPGSRGNFCLDEWLFGLLFLEFLACNTWLCGLVNVFV